MKFKGKDMGKFGAKQGEVIRVRQHVAESWKERVFVATHSGGFLCEVLGNNEGVHRWELVKPLPANQRPIPFTHETWPKQIVHIRKDTWDENVFDQVTGRYSEGVTHDGDRTTFDELLHHYLMSFDWGVTWQPCHYVEESD